MTDHDFYANARAFAQLKLGRALDAPEEELLQNGLTIALARGEPPTLETAHKVLERLKAGIGRALSSKEQNDPPLL